MATCQNTEVFLRLLCYPNLEDLQESWVMQQFKYWSSKLPVIMPICKTEPKLKAQNERFYWVDLSNRGFSCIKQPLFSGRQRTPSLVLEVILPPTYSRKEVIVERYRSCKLSEEVKYDTQGKTPSIRIVSCHPVPTDGGQQAHHFTSACQQPCCSGLCVADKGTWESCGRPVCESGAETSNWRGPTVSLSPMNFKKRHFSLIQSFLSFCCRFSWI